MRASVKALAVALGLALTASLGCGSAAFADNAPAADSSVMVLKSAIVSGSQITLGDLFDNAGPYAGVVVGTRTGSTAVLDAGTVQAVAAQAGAVWTNPRGLRRIIVASGAPTTSSTQTVRAPAASGNAALNRDVLTFTHPMNAGDIVTGEDMQYSSVVAMTAGADLPSGAQVAVGKIVRYPIRQGAIVRLTDLTSPTVVKRAETVEVTWAANGLSLTMSGTAQKDAAIGDLIQIQNPTSKKMIDAVVTGPGEALAGPAADQLRSNLLLSSR